MTPPADARAVFRDKAGNVTGWLAGPKLSDVEIYRLARRWWLPWRAMIMTAIALAESGGYVRATGDVAKVDAKWSTSKGLWQVRQLQSDHRDLYDPVINADAAADIERKQGLRAWGAFKRGAFIKFLPRAKAAQRAA